MLKILSFAQKGLIVDQKHSHLLASKYLTSKFLPEKLTNKLCLPGGQIEWGENPDISFIEEVRQETGITITPLLPFYIWSWTYPKGNTQKQIVAVARLGIYRSGRIKPPLKKKRPLLISPDGYPLTRSRYCFPNL